MNGESDAAEARLRAMDDAELAEEVGRGSTVALGEIFRRHKDPVYRVAYRITGTEQDAEDVLQDVFVGLSRALEKYHEQGRFGGWLRTVAARCALMRVRGRKTTGFEPLEHAGQVAGAPESDPVDRLAVREALAEMPDTLRRVFLLKEVEGYSHGEVAELLDIGVSASRVRLHRAWKFLDRRLSTS